jgi:hypothetical protein
MQKEELIELLCKDFSKRGMPISVAAESATSISNMLPRVSFGDEKAMVSELARISDVLSGAINELVNASYKKNKKLRDEARMRDLAT